MRPVRSEQSVSVRGVQIHLLSAGQGPALLYLHGAGDRGDWMPIFDRLAATHTVYRPDHPGFGHSGDDERIDTVHDLAFFYLDLIAALGIRDTVTVFGSSLGGWIAADLATIEPARVEKLILVGSSGLRVEATPQPDVFMLSAAELADLTFHREDMRERALALAAELDLDDAALQLYLRNRVGTAHLAWNPYFHDPKLPDRIHRVSAPALVVWGADDRLVPRAHADRWVELLPDARLVVIPDAGHLPHLERPDAVLESVAPFLSGAYAGSLT